MATLMAPASKKKKVEEDTSPLITLTVTKQQRLKDEKNMKVLKWNFTQPRGEFVEQLKLQMEKNFSKTMMDNLFHSDFKFHIKAIEALIKCLDTLQNEQIGNLDLILKWFTLRFFDTIPSMLNKGLEYLQALFAVLADNDYQLNDPEANSFMPYLMIKVGENKDNVRRDVRNLFKLIYKVFPVSKMFTFISDGIKSKNSKQRTECLEELGYLIETYGISICQPTPGAALKTIAAQISDRYNGVRNAALNTTVVAYMILGDNLYKYIGNLKEKDQSYLDERIKRSSKNRPPPGERPKSAPQGPQRSSSHARPPSPGPRFMNTADTANTINFVIAQVTNRDIGTCIEALAQIDEVIKDRDKVQVMADHVEQLLVAMSMQFKIVYTSHMGDEDTAKEDVIRLYTVLLATLLSIFQNSTLATQASKDILKELLNNLVTVLLDNRLNDLEDGPQIVLCVKVLVVKIVEESDQTNILCALIKLLHECSENETCSNKFINLNLTCLRKMVRKLPDIINELNLDRVLYDIHVFLRRFPSNSWKGRSNDLPLRTIKTIMHSLAKLKKSKSHEAPVLGMQNEDYDSAGNYIGGANSDIFERINAMLDNTLDLANIAPLSTEQNTHYQKMQFSRYPSSGWSSMQTGLSGLSGRSQSSSYLAPRNRHSYVESSRLSGRPNSPPYQPSKYGLPSDLGYNSNTGDGGYRNSNFDEDVFNTDNGYDRRSYPGYMSQEFDCGRGHVSRHLTNYSSDSGMSYRHQRRKSVEFEMPSPVLSRKERMASANEDLFSSPVNVRPSEYQRFIDNIPQASTPRHSFETNNHVSAHRASPPDSPRNTSHDNFHLLPEVKSQSEPHNSISNHEHSFDHDIHNQSHEHLHDLDRLHTHDIDQIQSHDHILANDNETIQSGRSAANHMTSIHDTNNIDSRSHDIGQINSHNSSPRNNPESEESESRLDFMSPPLYRGRSATGEQPRVTKKPPTHKASDLTHWQQRQRIQDSHIDNIDQPPYRNPHRHINHDSHNHYARRDQISPREPKTHQSHDHYMRRDQISPREPKSHQLESIKSAADAIIRDKDARIDDLRRQLVGQEETIKEYENKQKDLEYRYAQLRTQVPNLKLQKEAEIEESEIRMGGVEHEVVEPRAALRKSQANLAETQDKAQPWKRSKVQ